MPCCYLCVTLEGFPQMPWASLIDLHLTQFSLLSRTSHSYLYEWTLSLLTHILCFTGTDHGANHSFQPSPWPLKCLVSLASTSGPGWAAPIYKTKPFGFGPLSLSPLLVAVAPSLSLLALNELLSLSPFYATASCRLKIQNTPGTPLCGLQFIPYNHSQATSKTKHRTISSSNLNLTSGFYAATNPILYVQALFHPCEYFPRSEPSPSYQLMLSGALLLQDIRARLTALAQGPRFVPPELHPFQSCALLTSHRCVPSAQQAAFSHLLQLVQLNCHHYLPTCLELCPFCLLLGV